MTGDLWRMSQSYKGYCITSAGLTFPQRREQFLICPRVYQPWNMLITNLPIRQAYNMSTTCVFPVNWHLLFICMGNIYNNKNAWEKLVCQAVRGQAEREWQCRMSSNVNFYGFSCIQPVLLKPCELWVLGRNVPNLTVWLAYTLFVDCIVTTSQSRGNCVNMIQ